MQDSSVSNSQTTNDLRNTDAPKERSRFMKFVLSHKLVIFLVVVLIAVLAWALIHISVINSRHEKQTATLKADYEHRIDSLTVNNMELVTTVLSWGIRSEMIRGNDEQVNQFFLNFIRETPVEQLSIINPTTKQVVLSTNKILEGQVRNDAGLDSDDVYTAVSDSTVRVITPIMGLNKKLAVLEVDYIK